jgi:hypothetical protein
MWPGLPLTEESGSPVAFYPVMFSERGQPHLTVNKDNLQEEHLKALKARAQKRLEAKNRQNLVSSE